MGSGEHLQRVAIIDGLGHRCRRQPQSRGDRLGQLIERHRPPGCLEDPPAQALQARRIGDRRPAPGLGRPSRDVDVRLGRRRLDQLARRDARRSRRLRSQTPTIPSFTDELVAAAEDVSESQHEPPDLRATATVPEEVQHHPTKDPLERVVVDSVDGEVGQASRRALVGDEVVGDLGDRLGVPGPTVVGWRVAVGERDDPDQPIEELRTLGTEPSLGHELIQWRRWRGATAPRRPGRPPRRCCVGHPRDLSIGRRRCLLGRARRRTAADRPDRHPILPTERTLCHQTWSVRADDEEATVAPSFRRAGRDDRRRHHRGAPSLAPARSTR